MIKLVILLLLKLNSNPMKKIYTLLLIIVASITSYSQVIYIDPGHGYGATVSQNPDGRTSTEIESSLAVGLKLRTLLQNNCSSVIVHMSRTTNVNGWSNVSNRALQAQNWNADRLISIHCNADGNEANDASATSTATGTETYYSTAVKSTANTQSASVHSAYAKTMNAEFAAKGSMFKRNSGNPYLRDNLGIFGRSTTACLNEMGFVDNSNDKAKLLSNTWRDNFALGYYTGLKLNLNMSCSGSNVSAPGAFTLTVTPQCDGTTSKIALSWTASANATAYDIYRNGTLWDSNITSTTYTNTSGVVSGSTYTYYVKAKNSNSTQTTNSNGTVSVVAKNCTVLAPGAFTLTVKSECSTLALPNNVLTWTASANATAYDIYRNGALYASNITNTNYINTVVTPGTSYSYYIKAKNTTTTQTTNSNGTQNVVALNCAAPGAFTLTVAPQCDGTTSKVALSWTASANATAYDIYRNGALWDSNITSTTYTNTSGVVSGSTYTYSVKAKNSSSAQTTNSNGTLSIVALNCVVPGAFTLTTVTPQCNGATSGIALSWTPAANATAYDIYRNGNLYASNITNTTYTNTAVTPGISYSYYIKAKNTTTTQTTNSNGTQNVVALNCAAPGAFTLTVAPQCNGTTSRIALSWTASANATAYDIYRNGNLYASDITGNTFLNSYQITAGTAYTYYVKAKNSNSIQTTNSNGTVSVVAKNCAVSTGPGTFTLTATPICSDTRSAINLTWTAAANATSYDIYRNGNLYASDITGNTFLNTYQITAGTVYTYYVKAKNGNGSLNNSNGTVSVIAKTCATSKIIEDKEDDIDFKEILTLSFYPNPTNGILNLKINKINVQNIHYMIMDNNGRIVKENYLDESRIIDISELPSSTYFIRAIVDGEEFVKQIIKK